MDEYESLRKRLLDAVECHVLDGTALADDVFDIIVGHLKRALGRTTTEVEMLLGDLRVDIRCSIETAAAGMIDMNLAIDDMLVELLGHRG
jgi:hypothetical protein